MDKPMDKPIDILFQNVLITGGCGFIGSNFVNYIVEKYPQINFINLDKLDYCATTKNNTCNDYPNYKFIHGDILNEYLVLKTLNTYKIDAILHFAAQSHVDNSFGNSIDFTLNNVLGTHKLLEATRIYGNVKRFIHVSTDEVYGEIHESEGKFNEESVLEPTNPYAASKAGAEFVVKSYYRSFKIPIIITRGNNVYGPRQYPEKLIPKFINHLINNQKCPIQGQGIAVRNFIYVDDTVRAFEKVLFEGHIGEIYNIGTENEYSVMDVTRMLIKKLKNTDNYEEWITFVEDRNFNDIRYAIESSKLRELGWKEEMPDFETGLNKTIEWILSNPNHFD
jgi:dTDP-glucose 4,6-dehydratase